MAELVRITKEFKFETGHALFGHDGLCKNIHGHGYKLSVSLIGTPMLDPSNVKSGMVIDFSDLKKIIDKTIVKPFDHATVLNVNSPHIELADYLEKKGHKIKRVQYQPTSEMMIIDFAKKIKDELPKGLSLHHLILRETETCYVEWFASDQSP